MIQRLHSVVDLGQADPLGDQFVKLEAAGQVHLAVPGNIQAELVAHLAALKSLLGKERIGRNLDPVAGPRKADDGNDAPRARHGARLLNSLRAADNLEDVIGTPSCDLANRRYRVLAGRVDRRRGTERDRPGQRALADIYGDHLRCARHPGRLDNVETYSTTADDRD